MWFCGVEISGFQGFRVAVELGAKIISMARRLGGTACMLQLPSAYIVQGLADVIVRHAC